MPRATMSSRLPYLIRKDQGEMSSASTSSKILIAQSNIELAACTLSTYALMVPGHNGTKGPDRRHDAQATDNNVQWAWSPDVYPGHRGGPTLLQTLFEHEPAFNQHPASAGKTWPISLCKRLPKMASHTCHNLGKEAVILTRPAVGRDFRAWTSATHRAGQLWTSLYTNKGHASTQRPSASMRGP